MSNLEKREERTREERTREEKRGEERRREVKRREEKRREEKVRKGKRAEEKQGKARNSVHSLFNQRCNFFQRLSAKSIKSKNSKFDQKFIYPSLQYFH